LAQAHSRPMALRRPGLLAPPPTQGWLGGQSLFAWWINDTPCLCLVGQEPAEKIDIEGSNLRVVHNLSPSVERGSIEATLVESMPHDVLHAVAPGIEDDARLLGIASPDSMDPWSKAQVQLQQMQHHLSDSDSPVYAPPPLDWDKHVPLNMSVEDEIVLASGQLDSPLPVAHMDKPEAVGGKPMGSPRSILRKSSSTSSLSTTGSEISGLSVKRVHFAQSPSVALLSNRGFRQQKATSRRDAQCEDDRQNDILWHFLPDTGH